MDLNREMIEALHADAEYLRQMTGDDHTPLFLDGCDHCASEPEWVGVGWIEQPNNGPISPCPICNPTGALPRPTE